MKYHQLISEQRYTIDVLLQKGHSKKYIADAIGVHISTIYRELNRNKGKRGYTHAHAMMLSDERKERYLQSRTLDKDLTETAINLLKKEQWSPKQISGHLALEGLKISHESIYKIIRSNKAQGGDLYKNCRHKLKHRKRPVGKHIPIPDRVSIHDRPSQVDGMRFGDFEMDTIVGENNKGAIVTIVEKSTSMLLMKRLPFGKKADKLASVVVAMLLPYKGKILSITTDNGTEFACHKTIAKKLNTTVYFADPYSSWQKGAIENANKLIRQYIPKKMNFNNITDEYIKQVQLKLNKRPREKLNFYSPKQRFFENFS